MGDGEGAEGAGTLGMDDALGDAFPVLVGQLLEQLIVLHQHGAARASGDAVLIIRNGGAAGRRQDRLVRVGHS